MIHKSISQFLTLSSIILVVLSCSKEDDPKPAEPALLLLPSNGENCKQGEIVSDDVSIVNFSWELADNADNYSITITNLQTLDETKRYDIESNGISIYLDSGYHYKWSVTSFSSNFPDETPTSETWRFYLQRLNQTNSPPFPVEAVTPNPGEVISIVENQLFSLEWDGEDPDNDKLVYSVFLDTLDGRQPTSDDLKNLQSSNVGVLLQSNKIYYWSVVAEDVLSNTSTSQVFSFRTR